MAGMFTVINNPDYNVLKDLQLDIGDLNTATITGQIVPMLRANTSLKSLNMMNVKIPIEITCQLLDALRGHPEITHIEMRNSKLGYTLEAELERFNQAMLELAQPPSKLQSVIF